MWGHWKEVTVLVFKQVLWFVKFDYSAIIQHKYSKNKCYFSRLYDIWIEVRTAEKQWWKPWAVQDCVQSVCNSEHCAVSELTSNCLLNDLVGVVVDGRSGFVQHQDFCLAQKRSRQTDQLTLAHTCITQTIRTDQVRPSQHLVLPQIAASLWTVEIEFLLFAGDKVLQMGELKRSPYLLVGVLAERVQVHSNCAWENHRVLVFVAKSIRSETCLARWGRKIKDQPVVWWWSCVWGRAVRSAWCPHRRWWWSHECAQGCGTVRAWD